MYTLYMSHTRICYAGVKGVDIACHFILAPRREQKLDAYFVGSEDAHSSERPSLVDLEPVCHVVLCVFIIILTSSTIVSIIAYRFYFCRYLRYDSIAVLRTIAYNHHLYSSELAVKWLLGSSP